MSEMELKVGFFEKCDLDVTPEDTDEFYDLEEDHGCYYVKVDGQLYRATMIGNQEPYHGFEIVLPPSDKTHFVAYWYNGGASVHEVIEGIIRRHINDNSKPDASAI